MIKWVERYLGYGYLPRPRHFKWYYRDGKPSWEMKISNDGCLTISLIHYGTEIYKIERSNFRWLPKKVYITSRSDRDKIRELNYHLRIPLTIKRQKLYFPEYFLYLDKRIKKYLKLQRCYKRFCDELTRLTEYGYNEASEEALPVLSIYPTRSEIEKCYEILGIDVVEVAAKVLCNKNPEKFRSTQIARFYMLTNMGVKE